MDQRAGRRRQRQLAMGPAGGAGETSNRVIVSLRSLDTQSSPPSSVMSRGQAPPQSNSATAMSPADCGIQVEHADGVHTPVRHVDPGPAGGDAGRMDESGSLVEAGTIWAWRQPSSSRRAEPQLAAQLAGDDQVVLDDDEVAGPRAGGQPDRVAGGDQCAAVVEPEPVDLVAPQVAGQHLVADEDRLVGVRALLPLP